MPATILAYHGVTNHRSAGIENFQGKHIAAEEFERQMRYLRDSERVLSLSELVASYERGQDPDGVVVTFDDAYRNNATVALPILERLQVPATFFLSTGFIGNGRMFWVDEVEQLLDQADAGAIDLASLGLRRFSLITPESRMAAVTELKAWLKRLEESQKNRALAQLKDRLQRRPGAERAANYDTLSWEDVQRMAKSPVAELGGHTVDHAILSRLAPDQIQEQVVRSKTELENRIGREVTLFAYPNGGAQDYTPESIEILREAGYVCACTTLTGANTPATGLFELRRTMVGFCAEPFPFPLPSARRASTRR